MIFYIKLFVWWSQKSKDFLLISKTCKKNYLHKANWVKLNYLDILDLRIDKSKNLQRSRSLRVIDYRVIYRHSCAVEIPTSKKQEECLHGVRARYWPAHCESTLYKGGRTDIPGDPGPQGHGQSEVACPAVHLHYFL